MSGVECLHGDEGRGLAKERADARNFTVFGSVCWERLGMTLISNPGLMALVEWS